MKDKRLNNKRKISVSMVIHVIEVVFWWVVAAIAAAAAIYLFLVLGGKI